MLIFALLFLTIPTASASNAGDYPVSTFVKEVSLTVRLPEEAWIITQETPITDDFFQVVGTNAYAGIMNDLKTNSVYLDAINLSYTWEVRLAIQEGPILELKNIDYTTAQSYAQSTGNELKKRGLDVKENYAIILPETAVLVSCSITMGRNVILCTATTETKTIAITISDVYEGSISIDDLKSIANMIIDGLIFNSANHQSDQVKQDAKSIFISEIGLTLSLPEQMKWTTRSVGDTEYVAQNYNQSPSNLPLYMEKQNYYLMAVDPSSDLRVSLLRIEAQPDIKNSYLRTDNELLSALYDDEFSDVLSIFDLLDQWVWRNNEIAIACGLFKYGETDSFMVDAVTAIDGYLYTILIRDSDKSNMKKVAETIFQTFHVASQNFNDTLELKNCNVSTSLPNNWRIMEQQIETIEDVGPSDYALIEVYEDDGTRCYVALYILDYYSLGYGTNPTESQRMSL